MVVSVSRFYLFLTAVFPKHADLVKEKTDLCQVKRAAVVVDSRDLLL